MKHKHQHGTKIMDQKVPLSSENEESDYTATETSSMSETMRKKNRKSATQFSVLRSDTDGLRMKISAIRRKTTDSKEGDINKCTENNNLEKAKIKTKGNLQKANISMSVPTSIGSSSLLPSKSCSSILIDESDTRSEASNNGKIKKIKLKRKKTAKINDYTNNTRIFFTEERKKILNEDKERSLIGLNQTVLPDDNIGLSSSDNELPALVNAAIKCVESDSDTHSTSTQPKVQYTSSLLQDFMEKTQMLSAFAGKAKQSTERATTSINTNILNGADPPIKKKRGRPKKLQNTTVVNESADSGVVSSNAQSTSPSPKIQLQRSRSQGKVERVRDPSSPKLDIVNLDKRMYAMNDRVLYPPPRSKIRKQSTATKQTYIASTSSNIRASPITKTSKDDMLDPVWRKIDVNSKFRRPSVSGYKSDGNGIGASATVCSKILTAKSGYASDYGIRGNHYSGYKSDASAKSRCSMRSCYSRVSRAKSCDGKHRTKFRRKRRPTILNHSKSVENINEQDILQLAGLSLGQSSEESGESAVCKPKILAEEPESSNVYKKYGEINRYITTGEYFGRNKATHFAVNKNLNNSLADQESQDPYTFIGAIGNKLYGRSRKGSVTAAELPMHLGSSRKLKSRRSSVASFCSSSFYSGISKSKRRRRRKSFKFGCSKMVVVDSKLLTEIEIITNSFSTMCRIHCDKTVGGSYIKEKVVNERAGQQKLIYQNKRNLKKRKLSEHVDFALSNGVSLTTSTTTTGKRRHKKTCSSSPDDHKLPLKKRHYLLTPGEKPEKAHVVAFVTETLKSQKDNVVEPKVTIHLQKTSARTIATKPAITPKKRHLLQNNSEAGNNSPIYSNDTKSTAVKNIQMECIPTEVVNSKKRNRLEGLVSKIANASGNSSTENVIASPIVKGPSGSLQLEQESTYPTPGIFEPSVELEIQIPITKLGETSIITKSEVESPLDLLDMHSKTFPDSSSSAKVERVVESLLNKTGANLTLKRKRKKINRTGFPNVKRKKRKVSELSLTPESSDRKSENDVNAETICDRVPHTGETSDTFLERNRTPRLSVVSLERLQGTKQNSREEILHNRTRSTKSTITVKNKHETTEGPKTNKQLAKPLSKKKKQSFSVTNAEPIKVAVNPILQITFPTCKIRLKRRLEADILSKASGSLRNNGKETITDNLKLLPSIRPILPVQKFVSETVDFLEQEPLPLALYDVANAIDSESSSSASVFSEDSKSTNRKQKWKKNYLIAGLLSEYYKVSNSNVKGKKIVQPSQSKELYNESIECTNGPLLPPPPYCEKFFRRTETDFQLPYDIWWAYTNDKLPTRVTVPSWNYRKIRTNVYRCADVRPNTANIDRPTCNCKSDLGCGDDCLNRMVYTECYPSSCPTREKCQNQKIQRHEVAPGVERFMTENKGWGVRTKMPIKKGTYILEYVGEVVTEKEFKERMATTYANDTHHYCLHLDGGLVIDGHRMGSDGRFVNHSCSPNCEMQKWSVNGLSRMALFAARNIEPGEEISYDYNFSLFNPSEGQECRCNTPQCRGVIGGKSQRIKPLIDHSKQVDVPIGQSSGRRNGRQRKRQGSARRDIVRLQSKDVVMTQMVQQLSEKDKRLIKAQRIFLIKNFEKVRRIRSKGVPLVPIKPDQACQTAVTTVQRRPSTPSSLAVQISALRSPRNIQTRGLTQAVQDPEVEKMAKMAVVFRAICSALEAIRDETGRPHIVMLNPNPVKRKGKPAKLPATISKTKYIEFSTIQVNVEKGFYKDPVEFDADMENLLAGMRDHNKDNANELEIINKLSYLYTKTKDKVYDQLVDLVVDKNSLTKFRPNATIEVPPATGVVSKHFSAKGKQTKSLTEDIIGCICGLFKDEGLMIQCARCMVWQHTECTKADVNADSYLCERCEPRIVDREIPLDDFTDDGDRYYLSLMRGDLQIRQGDTVYVLRDIPIKDEKGNVCTTKKHTYETIGEIDYSECDIFRVERLWKDKTGKRVIFGHHFLRPHETFHEPTRRFYPNEVVRVPLYEVVPIELVIGRCFVLDRTTFCNGRPADCTNEDHVYICELRVDKTARFFSKAKINWPTCTKNYAFKRFEEKLKVFKSYAPHDVDPALLKQRKQKTEPVYSKPTTSPRILPSSTKKTTIGVKRNKIIQPPTTKKQKRNHLEIVLAAIKKLKSKNTQISASVLDVSYLLSGRGARQRKSIVANVPI